MATTITLKKSKQEIEDLYKRFLPKAMAEANPPYTYWQLKLAGGNITAYQSGKVLIQGKEAEAIADAADRGAARSMAAVEAYKYPEAGTDEVGCGDYYGPIVVGACIVPDSATAAKLTKAGLNDTKKLTDKKVRELAKEIRLSCHTKVVVLKPERYNQAHRDKNMVEIKCMMHNLAWKAMATEHDLPGRRIVDQFCPEDKYYHYTGSKGMRGLTFETKADTKYVSVMCAAVLARSRYLEEMEKMEKEWNTLFPKGAGSDADNAGVKFIMENGYENLHKVAKTGFKNTEKVKRLMELYKGV